MDLAKVVTPDEETCILHHYVIWLSLWSMAYFSSKWKKGKTAFDKGLKAEKKKILKQLHWVA